MGQCATKLILRAQDPETAQFLSEQLGRRLVRRMDESTSYGANSIRDGVGLTPKEEFEPVALPEDILNLPKFQGYLRLSNAREDVPFPIAPVKFAYGERPQVAPGFVPVGGPDPIERFLKAVRGGEVGQAAASGVGAGDGAPDRANPGQAMEPQSTPRPTTDELARRMAAGQARKAPQRRTSKPDDVVVRQGSLFDLPEEARTDPAGTAEAPARGHPPASPEKPDPSLGLDYRMPEG
jgi:hypothetical protein